MKTKLETNCARCSVAEVNSRRLPNGGRALAFLSCSSSAGSLSFIMAGTFYPKIKS